MKDTDTKQTTKKCFLYLEKYPALLRKCFSYHCSLYLALHKPMVMGTASLPIFASFFFFKRAIVFFLFQYLFIWLHKVFVLAHRIFSCSMRDLVSWPGMEPRPPALGVWSLSHWTTKDVPYLWNRRKNTALAMKEALMWETVIEHT